MASFSASDAALTGFRIVRERPKAVLIWSAIQFAITLTFSVGMVWFAGPALTKLNAVNAEQTPDPAKTMAILQQLSPLLLCVFVFLLIFYPVLYATMSRVVLRPSEEGFAYIRLGADELRQLGLLLLIFALGIVAYIVLILALVAIVTPFSLAITRGSAGGGSGGAVLAVLFAILLGLAVIGAWIYVWVRLSLASPLTFATQRISLFGSWRLTKGLFWPMLGAYLVALILALVVWMLTVVITLAATAITGGGLGGLAGVFNPDMSSLSAYLTPARIVSFVISALSSALVWPVLLTPAAAIYRSLPGAVGETSATAAAFD